LLAAVPHNLGINYFTYTARLTWLRWSVSYNMILQLESEKINTRSIFGEDTSRKLKFIRSTRRKDITMHLGAIGSEI